jgi:hypothetical protein
MAKYASVYTPTTLITSSKNEMTTVVCRFRVDVSTIQFSFWNISSSSLTNLDAGVERNRCCWIAESIDVLFLTSTPPKTSSFYPRTRRSNQTTCSRRHQRIPKAEATYEQRHTTGGSHKKYGVPPDSAGGEWRRGLCSHELRSDVTPQRRVAAQQARRWRTGARRWHGQTRCEIDCFDDNVVRPVNTIYRLQKEKPAGARGKNSAP